MQTTGIMDDPFLTEEEKGYIKGGWRVMIRGGVRSYRSQSRSQVRSRSGQEVMIKERESRQGRRRRLDDEVFQSPMNWIIFHNGAEGCGELIDGADGNACPARLGWIGVYYYDSIYMYYLYYIILYYTILLCIYWLILFWPNAGMPDLGRRRYIFDQ